MGRRHNVVPAALKLSSEVELVSCATTKLDWQKSESEAAKVCHLAFRVTGHKNRTHFNCVLYDTEYGYEHRLATHPISVLDRHNGVDRRTQHSANRM